MLLETKAVVALASRSPTTAHTPQLTFGECAQPLPNPTPFRLAVQFEFDLGMRMFSSPPIFCLLKKIFWSNSIWFWFLSVNCRDQKWQAPPAEAVQVAATEALGAQALPPPLEHQLCTRTKNWKPSRADYITEEQHLCRHPRGAVSHVWIPPAPGAKRLEAQFSLCHTPPTHSPSLGLRAADTISFNSLFVKLYN